MGQAGTPPEKIPPQRQAEQPGRRSEMEPKPRDRMESYQAAGEGADIAIVYLEEKEDAEQTRRLVEEEGRRCLLQGDVGSSLFCREAGKWSRIVRKPLHV
jgi:hypothetical protein